MSAADACFDLPIIPDATGLFEGVYDDVMPTAPFQWPKDVEVHEFGVSIPIREEDAAEWKTFVDNWNAMEKKRQDYQCAKIFEDYMKRNDEAVQKALLIPDGVLSPEQQRFVDQEDDAGRYLRPGAFIGGMTNDAACVGYFVCPACGQDHEYGASCPAGTQFVGFEAADDKTAPCPASPVGQSHSTSCVLCKGSGRVEAL